MMNRNGIISDLKRPDRLQVQAVCCSITGAIRDKNEDNYCFLSKHRLLEDQNPEKLYLTTEMDMTGQWMAVFDGIGGLPKGEIASLTAAGTLASDHEEWTEQEEAEYEDKMKQTVGHLNTEIIRWRREHKVSQIGTTIAAIKFGRHALYGVSSGDSAIYRLRKGQWQQLSVKHIFYYPGHLRPMLTGFLGTEREEDPVKTDIYQWDYQAGDKYLLCTDGVSGQVWDQELAEIMALPPKEAMTALMEAVERIGANDNATAIIMEIQSVAQ